MKLDIAIKFQNGFEAITKKDNKADGEKNDCVVRALMNAFDISYNKAHSIAEKVFGRERLKGTQGTYLTLMKMAEGEIETPNKKKIKPNVPQKQVKSLVYLNITAHFNLETFV